MISPERKEELEELFWSETNEEWTQQWRFDLTEEEADLVDAWEQALPF